MIAAFRFRFFADVLDKIYSGIGPVQRGKLKQAVQAAYQSCLPNQQPTATAWSQRVTNRWPRLATTARATCACSWPTSRTRRRRRPKKIR